MADSELMNYIGVVTGIIGAVTGILGAVMGFIGYRRSNQLKTLDLRLEYRKAENVLGIEMKELASLMETAKNSHNAVTAASGGNGSGKNQLWQSEYLTDITSLKTLEAQLPKRKEQYEKMTYAQLESGLIQVHLIQSRALRIRDKYQAFIDADDKVREHIRAKHG